MANKSPIGFVKSYPKLILKPTEQKQYEGGDLILVASGIWIEPRDYEETEEQKQ